MSRAAAERTIVGVAPGEVAETWCTPSRWPEFVDGLARVGSADPPYPEPGSVVEWSSYPAGRGEVREIVVEYVPGSLVASDVEDESTTARQAVTFAAAPGGTTVRIELDYELRRRGPFTALTDLLFVRRAQADSLRRTLAGLDLAVTAEQP
ncbi:MAG: SRPBCC family protein [Solirubrobacterales bacterium]